jgi:hypothetical protein
MSCCDGNSDNWHVVTAKKKKVRSKLSDAKCNELEIKLNIRNLAKCLSSYESKSLQDQGYQFWKTVSETDKHTLPENIVTLPVQNKWKDLACFVQKI